MCNSKGPGTLLVRHCVPKSIIDMVFEPEALTNNSLSGQSGKVSSNFASESSGCHEVVGTRFSQKQKQGFGQGACRT